MQENEKGWLGRKTIDAAPLEIFYLFFTTYYVKRDKDWGRSINGLI